MVGLIESARSVQTGRNGGGKRLFMDLPVHVPEQPQMFQAEPEHEEFVRREGAGHKRC